jgi:hypothetical protein
MRRSRLLRVLDLHALFAMHAQEQEAGVGIQRFEAPTFEDRQRFEGSDHLRIAQQGGIRQLRPQTGSEKREEKNKRFHSERKA